MQGLALVVNSANAIINIKNQMKIKNTRQPPSSLGLTVKGAAPRKSSLHIKVPESQQFRVDNKGLESILTSKKVDLSEAKPFGAQYESAKKKFKRKGAKTQNVFSP